MIEKITELNKCTGCTTCMNVCPKNAISMVEKKGFFYPAVSEACIECKLCITKCPINNSPKVSTLTKAFAVQNRNEEIRAESTSGGFFSLLCDYVFEKKGVVCGVGFDDNARVIHKIINSLNDVYDLRGSKYCQSNLGNVFKQIKKNLDENCYVLFVGLPCQCSGLLNYLGKEYENLLIVDLVCYGVPSPVLYDRWIRFIENKYKKTVNRVIFRDKSYGFALPNCKILFNDSSFIEQKYDSKSFLKMFFNGLNIRESCSMCKFKGINRATDFTLGDCWSIKEFESNMDDNKGTTAVYVHSDKGLKIIENLNTAKLIEIDVVKSIKLDGKKVMNSVKLDKKYYDFCNNINEYNYKKLAKKYAPESIKEKITNIIKPFAKKNKLLNKLLRKIR